LRRRTRCVSFARVLPESPVAARLAVAAAVLSSALGGMALAASRFVIGATDAVALGAWRYCVGFVCLLPITCAVRGRWPARRDWAGVALLGLLFFAIFPILYNLSIAYTTAARASLALSTLPLLTMLTAAVLSIEKLTLRKSAGVAIAVAGVAAALAAGLADAPAGAWRGDLLMVAGAFCMALYNVWSRPFIARSSPLAFLTAGMGVGALCLAILSLAGGGFVPEGFGAPQWAAVLFVGIFGAALNFYLWVWALERTTPTRVATTITVNPVSASLLAAVIIGEPIGANLALGIAAVLAGIWIAATEAKVATEAKKEQDQGPARIS
jgi:drug/metabolite transporter (DMT)-like permease